MDQIMAKWRILQASWVKAVECGAQDVESLGEVNTIAHHKLKELSPVHRAACSRNNQVLECQDRRGSGQARADDHGIFFGMLCDSQNGHGVEPSFGTLMIIRVKRRRSSPTRTE